MESFEEIYKRMFENYSDITGNNPSELSDIAIRLKLLAGEIFSCQMNLDFIKKQMFLQSATGQYLDYHGKLRGVTRKQSIKAVGEVNFGTANSLLTSLVIPKGTVVATSGETPVLFETTEDAVISQGQARVTVNCIAQEGGEKGNVGIGEISVLVTPVGNIITISNTKSFKGGVNEESDENFRKRIEDTIINVSNGTNIAYYKKLALSVDGVQSVGVIPLNRGKATVDVFISGKGTAASSALVEEVQQLMNQRREINTDVRVESATQWTITFTMILTVKSGFDFDVVKENCIAKIREYVSNLGVGVPVYIADLSDVVYHIDGVKNHSFSSSDRFPTQKVFPVVSSINVLKGTE